MEAEADTDVNGDSSSTSSCVADGELEPVVEAGDDREPEGLADVIAGATDRSGVEDDDAVAVGIGEAKVEVDGALEGDTSNTIDWILDAEAEAEADTDGKLDDERKLEGETSKILD